MDTPSLKASAQQLLDCESSHQTHAALPVSEEGRDVPGKRGTEGEGEREGRRERARERDTHSHTQTHRERGRHTDTHLYIIY